LWDYVPATIAAKLKLKAENNNYGEVVKILMITSSGAEGINLRNTRFVHIVEPYWHMVRIDQVVGRARRICSHQDLPPEMRTVKVFLYISTFSEEQKTDEANIELRIRDVSRLDQNTPVTTDETLYEMSSIKQRINNEILKAVKESAIDCKIYSTISKNSENLICYGVDVVKSNQFSFMNNPLSIDKSAFSKKVVNLNQKLNDTMMENTKKQESISDYSSGSNKI
jgi:archaellin